MPETVHAGFLPGGFVAATLAGVMPARRQAALGADGCLRWLDHGVLQYEPGGATAEPGAALLLSAGVHGNETAPIEMLDALVEALLSAALRPPIAVMILLGNPAAMAADRRFVEENMNRLFLPAAARTAVSAERQRAQLLMQHAESFLERFDAAVHLDLHTAIRGSRYRRFAISPAETAAADWLAHLGDWGVQAVVHNPRTRSTFAAWSAARCRASFTVELGRARPFGENFPEDILPFRDGLWHYLAAGRPGASTGPAQGLPRDFVISREIIKHDRSFRLHFSDDSENFTEMAAGRLLATDGAARVHAQEGEHILFPNAKVAVGERALLLIRRRGPTPACAPGVDSHD